MSILYSMYYINITICNTVYIFTNFFSDMSSVANQSTVKTFTLQPACLDAAANYTLDREFTPHEDSFPLVSATLM